MGIQWYPGLMARARRLLKEDLALVDVVLEVVEARAPLSSRNPELVKMLAGRASLLVLNKTDLAEPLATRAWLDYWRRTGLAVLTAEARTGKGMAEAEALVRQMAADRRNKRRAVRLMVVGIPNVGKSSVLNRLLGRAGARTGDLPGVTRGRQWVRLPGELEVLDTPGILWPGLGDPEISFRLAALGAISEEAFDSEGVAGRLLQWILERKPAALRQRYGEGGASREDWSTLEGIARRRGLLLPGGEPHQEQAATLLLKEFRQGRLGRFTLELPPLISSS